MLMFALPASAQNSAEDSKPAKLFDRVETLEASMTGPWRELVRKENFQGSYPAKIEFVDELGNAQSIDLAVKRRGVTRQQVCRIPPIKLDFKKGAAKGTTFRGQDSLKMVTHCQKSSGYEQYYILEMLAYRMYGLLTDFSFKVRPLSVTYHQVENEDAKESRFSFFKKETSVGPVFAFLIEAPKDVAKRHGLKNLHIPRISPAQLDSYESALFSLFQFMIANIDWAATSGPDPDECCHNVKLIGPEPTGPEDTLYAIPYDFDSSGLVNSEYAAPPVGVPITRVTQRLYRGYCASNPSLDKARKTMLANEQAIYDLVTSEDRLTPEKQRKALRFLEGFFEIIKDDNEFQEKVVKKCR